MRTALSIILAATLVTTPVKLVLAQAAKQEAATVRQTAPPDSSGHRLIGVPSATGNTSRLWEPLASEDARESLFAYDDSEALVAAPQEIGGGGGATALGLILAFFLVVGLVVFIVVSCADETTDC